MLKREVSAKKAVVIIKKEKFFAYAIFARSEKAKRQNKTGRK